MRTRSTPSIRLAHGKPIPILFAPVAPPRLDQRVKLLNIEALDSRLSADGHRNCQEAQCKQGIVRCIIFFDVSFDERDVLA